MHTYHVKLYVTGTFRAKNKEDARSKALMALAEEIDDNLDITGVFSSEITINKGDN